MEDLRTLVFVSPYFFFSFALAVKVRNFYHAISLSRSYSLISVDFDFYSVLRAPKTLRWPTFSCHIEHPFDRGGSQNCVRTFLLVIKIGIEEDFLHFRGPICLTASKFLIRHCYRKYASSFLAKFSFGFCWFFADWLCWSIAFGQAHLMAKALRTQRAFMQYLKKIVLTKWSRWECMCAWTPNGFHIACPIQ